MERERFDYLFKFIIIGNTNTGKSCLLHYFLENKCKRSASHTIGVEFGSKVLSLGSKSVKLQIWDTAGQERFRSVARSYYRGALGAIILYDLTSRDAFENVSQWLKDARELARSDIACVLVGNKTDLKDDREVETEEGARFAEENGIPFFETSAVSGENVHEVFQTLSKNILTKIEGGLIDASEIQPKMQGTIKSGQSQNESYSGSKCLCG